MTHANKQINQNIMEHFQNKLTFYLRAKLVSANDCVKHGRTLCQSASTTDPFSNSFYMEFSKLHWIIYWLSKAWDFGTPHIFNVTFASWLTISFRSKGICTIYVSTPFKALDCAT